MDSSDVTMARIKFTVPKEETAQASSTTTEAAQPKVHVAKAKELRSSKPANAVKGYSKEAIGLYTALKYGTDGNIDHAKVADAAGITVSAAKTRYNRVMEQIEASLAEGADDQIT